MSHVVQHEVALAPLTTLKTGGKATYYVVAETVTDLEKAVAFAEQKQLPFCVLGGGSNMLVSDAGYDGIIIHMQCKGVTYREGADGVVLVHVAAGEVFDDVVADTVARGLWGLENLSHIPGSTGATPVQNVGAYGVEVADVIETVTVYDTESKTELTLTNADCHFTYRHSLFKERTNYIITSVTFALSTQPNPKLAYADLAVRVPSNPQPSDVRAVVVNIRSEKFPDWTVVGTAGSFFKNPILDTTHATALALQYPDIPMYPSTNGTSKIALGYVLDKICNLKGFAIGPVRLYEKQALVLVAERGATTSDIKNFVTEISDVVFKKTGIKISQEVTEI